MMFPADAPFVLAGCAMSQTEEHDNQSLSATCTARKQIRHQGGSLVVPTHEPPLGELLTRVPSAILRQQVPCCCYTLQEPDTPSSSPFRSHSHLSTPACICAGKADMTAASKCRPTRQGTAVQRPTWA